MTTRTKQKRWVLVALLASCSAFAWRTHAQEDRDAEIIEEDCRVTSLEGRQRAVASLLTQAEHLRSSGQIVEAVRTLNRVGRFQIRMFLPDQAVTTAQQALSLLEQQPDEKTHIDSLNGLAAGYDYLSRCDLAEPPARQARTLSIQNKYVAGQADALLTVSDCQNHSDHVLAFKSAQESLDLWRSVNRKRGMAEAYVVMGHDQLAQNNLVESSKYIDAALNLYRELNDVGQQASVLIYLGYIEFRKGAWQDAMAFYSQAQSMIDEKAEPYKMGQISGGLAESFLETGSYDVALTKFRESLEYFRLTKNQRAMTAMGWLIGQSQYLSGNYQEALVSLQVARSEGESAKDIATTAYCDDFMGRTYFALHDYAAALTHYQSALEGYSRARNAMEKSRVQALIGQVYQQQGDLEKASRNFEAALAGFSALDDQVNGSATLYAIGKLELQRNALDAAQDYLQRSIESTEEIRRASTSSDLMTAFSANVYERYEAFIECLMRRHLAQPTMGLDVTAFETHELARSRSLTELLRATQSNLLKGLDPKLAEREKSLRQTLLAKRDAKVRLLSTSYGRDQLTSLDAELARLELEYKEVNTLIRERFPAYDQITRPGKLSLQEIQKRVLVDDDTLLLEYGLGTSKSYLWAITRDGFSSSELPGRAVIEQAARDLYTSLTARQPKPGDVPVQLRARVAEAEAKLPAQISALSRILLGPVLDKLHHQRLLIVADGLLQSIPFQALAIPATQENSGELRPLVMDHEIVNEPSASALAVVLSEAANREPAPNSVAILADPVFEADDPRLKSPNAGPLQAAVTTPIDEFSRALRDVGVTGGAIPRLLSSRQEAESIMAVVPWRTGSKAVDFDANRAAAIRSDLGQYRVVHFATHAFLINDHPELSGIVLSRFDQKGQPQDGYLRLQDIYNLKLPVDLVVLSACQTGLGKDVKGEGLIGLTRGFMYAGASGVVASLWKVDDEATAELMKHFYQGMFDKGLSPAAALRDAQLAMRQEKRWHEPYYWAGFVIQGRYDGRENVSRPWAVPKLAILAGLGVLFALTIILMLRRRRQKML